MVTKKNEPKAKDKKEPKLEIRDLKPKTDPKGGARSVGSGEKRTPRSTGEIDFMNWD